MAKKPEKKIPEPHSRTAEVTPQDLRDYAHAIAKEAGLLEATAKAMEKDGFDQMVLDGRSKVTRAIALLREYNLNADTAYRRAKLRAGD